MAFRRILSSLFLITTILASHQHRASALKANTNENNIVADENIKNHRLANNGPAVVKPAPVYFPKPSQVLSAPVPAVVQFKPSPVDDSPYIQPALPETSSHQQDRPQIQPVPSQTVTKPIYTRSLGESGERRQNEQEILNTEAQTNYGGRGFIFPGIGYGGGGGYYPGSGGNNQKPGSCYRPNGGGYGGYGGNNGGFGSGLSSYGNNYQYARSNNNAGYYFQRSDSNVNDEQRVKRDASPQFGYGGGGGGNNYGGGHGGIIYPPTTTYRPAYCRRDYDCPGNQKCCSGSCRTPSFSG